MLQQRSPVTVEGEATFKALLGAGDHSDAVAAELDADQEAITEKME